jgi:hypothetical protein
LTYQRVACFLFAYFCCCWLVWCYAQPALGELIAGTARVLGQNLEVRRVRRLLVLKDWRAGGLRWVTDKVDACPVVGNVIVGACDRIAVKVRDEETWATGNERAREEAFGSCAKRTSVSIELNKC